MTSNEKMIWAAAFAAGYWDKENAYSAGQLAYKAGMAVTIFRFAEHELRENEGIEAQDALEMLREFSADGH